MAKRKQDVDSFFNVLNSEFSIEKSKSKDAVVKKKSNVTQKRASSSQKSSAKAEKKSRGLGIASVFFCIFTAFVFCWAVFMPEGSINELANLISNKFSQFIEQTEISDLFSDSHETQNSRSSLPQTTSATTIAETTYSMTETQTTASIAETTVTQKPKTTTSRMPKTTQITNVIIAPDNLVCDHITVYLKSQIVAVYNSKNEVVKAFTCSSGKSSTPTRTGNYEIHHKYRWRLMIGNSYTQYASAFSGSYLFHSIPYNKRDASTMSNASYDKLGSGASAGCIRLCCRDSKWIYENCPIGTKVSVINQAAPSGIQCESIPPRIKEAAYSGWDPTDPSEKSPYNL